MSETEEQTSAPSLPPPPATPPAAPEAPAAKKSGMRVPLRFQITGLLVIFVGTVAFASFRSMLSFLERDKTATLNVLQTLQVDQVSKNANERISALRRSLRDAALPLLDPTRANEAVTDGRNWAWVRVRDKSIRSPNFQGELPPTPTDLRPGKFHLRSGAGDALLFVEPFVIKQGGTETEVFLEGQASKRYVFGDPVDLDRGPVRGAVVDMSSIGRAGGDVGRSVWVGTEGTAEAFAAFFSSLDPSYQLQLSRPTTATSRDMRLNDGETMLASWATLPIANAEQNLAVISFVSKSALLAGFRRMVFELAFWALLVLGAGVIAARYLSSRLSKPIEDLVEASKVLETGDFHVRVKQDRNDEIGDLAAAFNHMGQALDERETALKAAQNALIQNEKLAAIGTLSAGIAHEVKNPLAGILGNAELAINGIKKHDLPNQSVVLRYVETIQKETKRCQQIIDGLMRFSRGEASSAGNFEPMDLEVIAWEAIQLMEYALSKTSVRIEKQFVDGAWMVNGAHNQVEQVLLNMIQNAGHAMANGGVLTVGTEFFPNPQGARVGRFLAFESPEFQGPFVRVFIRDTGTGMTEEIQRKIFEPFFTTKARGVGTGLGLAVTMGILGDHKARVSLDSAPGQGTTFYLDFMALQERTEKVRAHIEETRHRKAGGAKLSTDVGATPPSYSPSSAAPSESPLPSSLSESPSEAPSSIDSGLESAAAEGGEDEDRKERSSKIPSPEIGAESAGLPSMGNAKFAIRKPTMKG